MRFCVTVTQKFVGNKLQLSHTRFCVTCTQPFLQYVVFDDNYVEFDTNGCDILL